MIKQAQLHAESDAGAEYAGLLQAYLNERSETNLAAGYQWGRRALEQGDSIPDVISAHHRAFVAWCRGSGANRSAGSDEAAARFLAESLAPYEMARRGVREAVMALRHVNEALERESQRIARAVHDEAGQLAVVLQLSLAELEMKLPNEAAATLQPLHATLDHVEQQLRRLSHELRPSMLDDLGWLPAIRWLAQSMSGRGQLKVSVQSDFEARLSGRIEIAIYRVVHEALTNVVRHASAKYATITVAATASTLSMTVADDGVGFDPSAAVSTEVERGLGLLGIRERLAAVGGTLQIGSRPRHGTQLVMSVPLELA